MGSTGYGHKPSNRQKGQRQETVEKYREAVGLYASTRLSCREICSRCGVSVSGFGCYLSKYHRNLMLARYDIRCSREEAGSIRLGQLRGQLPATREKYKDAIAACADMDFIEFNISQIARMFGLDGSGLCRQLRTHYPEIVEFREKARLRLGIDDHLPRGSRPFAKEQYAEAVALLKGNSYITVQQAADRCNVSYSGLEQHLLFYHKSLVKKRIKIREEAVRKQIKGEITGRGTVHAPSPALVEKYKEALHLYSTTPLSLAKIAAQAQVSKKGFYEYLHRWRLDLVCQRKGIPYEEGVPVDFSQVRRYQPATRAKYAEAIRKLQENNLSTAQVAAEFGLHPETFRGYLKEHEPELYARQGKASISRGCMEKYAEAIRLYRTTTESINSIARRFGFNACSFRQYVQRHFPEAVKERKERNGK